MQISVFYNNLINVINQPSISNIKYIVLFNVKKEKLLRKNLTTFDSVTPKIKCYLTQEKKNYLEEIKTTYNSVTPKIKC